VDALKAIGISEVLVYCVNDGAVMDAWGKDQGIEKSGGLVNFYGDPSLAVTKALDMVLDHPGPMSKLGYPRSKRFALYVENGVVKLVRVSEAGPKGEEDPAGDDFPEATLAPQMIAAIKELKAKDEM